ncbi:type IV pilus biogenesis protein PilP [Burkholderia stagnalis]|nr:type IV pilus biogenesis protein PilP [Burkholderia stagnalis]RQR20303.1 type IV pilus biogenesis protein PilP [Burkholderia stagnalis]
MRSETYQPFVSRTLSPNVVAVIGAAMMQFGSMSAHAEPSDSRLATVEQMTASQNATLMYTIRAREADAKAQFEQKSGGATQSDDSGIPVVTGIFGSHGVQYAKILFPDGVTADAYPGRVVRGGYKVETVSLEKVELSKRGKRMELGTSDSAPAPAKSASMQGSAGGLPMGGPMPMNGMPAPSTMSR